MYKACFYPKRYKAEFDAYIEAGESPEPLSENILFHIEDTVSHYRGKNTNYKVFNEPTHGDGYRANYDDIWNRVIETARKADPNIVKGFFMIFGTFYSNF